VIAESQLQIWSQQGKTGQFTDTYAQISANLLDSSAPYAVKDCEVFLQGSYGNDTNVWADSDVDIVLKHNGTFYKDLTRLSPEALARYNAAHSGVASYPYDKFKADAVAFLTLLYNGIVPGKKAMFIPGKNTRRNADVLVAQQFRRYYDVLPDGTERFEPGVCFFSDGKLIENFPKQHSANCTAKHQATKQNFKHMVRIFKNMRNRMIEQGLLADGVAPSYFLEGMLYNVPDDKFTGTYQSMWVECFNWTVSADRDKLMCASRMHWLVRDGTPTSWPVANFNTFTATAKKFWES